MPGAQGVQIEDVDLPDSLDPGASATARIDMTNTSNFINPWNANRCNEGNNYGLLVEGVLVGPDGEEFVGDTVCAKQHDLVASYEATSEVTFEAPERDGTHRYDAFVRLAETGEESSRLSESVDVYGDSGDAPEEAPDNAGEGPGSDDSPWTPSGESGVGARTTLILAVVLLFGGMYAAGNLFDIQIGGGA